jgi:hypothetical protein
VHEQALQIVRDLVGEGTVGLAEILGGAGTHLAALTAIRGPDAARDHLAALTPAVRHAVSRLEIGPRNLDEVTTIGVLTAVAAGDAAGAPVALDSVDLEAVIDRLLVSRALSKQEKAIAALLALGFDRPDDAANFVGKGALSVKSADPVALARLLAAATKDPKHRADVAPAWDAFLADFPAAFLADKADWGHLLLAARVVLGKLGGTPAGEVADTLHRRVLALAAPSA